MGDCANQYLVTAFRVLVRESFFDADDNQINVQLIVNCTPFVRQACYHTCLTNGVQFFYLCQGSFFGSCKCGCVRYHSSRPILTIPAR